MPKITTPQLTPDGSAPEPVRNLQNKVVAAIQSICQQVNAAVFTRDAASDDLDMGHHRISNLKDPSSEKDAVNLGFLRRSFKTGQQPAGGSGDGIQYYQIIFDNQGGDITTGSNAAYYPVAVSRAGTPIEANISAGTPSSGSSIKVNFNLISGTSTTAILNTPLELPAGSRGMVVSTDFAITNFQYLDKVELVVTQVGSTTPGGKVAVGIVVRKS